MHTPYPLEIDHLFCYVSPNAPEVAVLAAAGLQLDDHIAEHTGNGTCSRLFLFKNVYLELVWASDEALALATATYEDVSLGHRSHWRTNGACPFGVGLRTRDRAATTLPFPTVAYTPPWLPDDCSLDIVPHASPFIPTWFVVGGRLAYRRVPEAESTHPARLERLTQVSITLTHPDKLDAVGHHLADNGVVEVKTGSVPLLELVFDGGRQGKTIDARPTLPMVFSY